jgi:MFS family permease
MIGWRVVQAVGACAGVVLARAMVRDLYAGDRAAQMLSTLLTVMAIAPLAGPIIDAASRAGYLLDAGWRRDPDAGCDVCASGNAAFGAPKPRTPRPGVRGLPAATSRSPRHRICRCRRNQR